MQNHELNFSKAVQFSKVDIDCNVAGFAERNFDQRWTKRIPATPGRLVKFDSSIAVGDLYKLTRKNSQTILKFLFHLSIQSNAHLHEEAAWLSGKCAGLKIRRSRVHVPF